MQNWQYWLLLFSVFITHFETHDCFTEFFATLVRAVFIITTIMLVMSLV